MQDAQYWLRSALAIGVCFGFGCGDGPGIEQTNRKPTVELKSPTEGAQYQTGALYIEAQINDPDVGDTPDTLRVSLTSTRMGGTPTTIFCDGGVDAPSASGLFTCNTANSFEPGNYTLQVTATDTRGAFSINPPVSITVNNDAPECLFRTPESGSTTDYDESVPVTMVLECDDPDGENSDIEVCVDSDLSGRLGCGQASSSGEVSLQVTFPSSGTHLVTATATDAAGIEGTDSFTAVVRECTDADGDGVSACSSVDNPPDCDDDDWEAYPGNEEVCNGVDNDCDGIPDNIVDLDGDGYLCNDCDNTVISINPAGVETCDGRDNNCDGVVDEPFDLDGDGYMSACEVEIDGETRGIDCDDSSALVHPDADEICDGLNNDCAGEVDDRDFDEDGWVDSACTAYTGDFPGDCNDTNPYFNPGATEICDRQDEDCDGRLDNDTVCFDDDGDGFCEAGCTDPSVSPGDCDDTFAYTYPGAVERFDHRDNNCDNVQEGDEFPIDLAWLFLDGSSQSSQHGRSLDGGGDLNGDGIGDIIIGAPEYNNGTGQAHVILGREEWAVGQPISIETLEGSYTYSESRAGSAAGTAVAILGDINDDGMDDFAIGSPLADVSVPGFTFPNAGSAYVFQGHADNWSNAALSSAMTRIDGTAEGVNLGHALDGGTVNDDEFADVIIGAPHPTGGSTSGSGWAFIFPGRFSGFPAVGGPTSVFQFTGDASQQMGDGIAYIGHHDGDDIGDFAVVGPGSAASVGLVQRIPGSPGYISGNRSSFAENRTGAWLGESSGESIGNSLDGGGDIDGNGYDEIFFSRKLIDIDGSLAFVILGANGVVPKEGSAEEFADIRFIGQESDNCPCTITHVGDMNGDGIGDLAVAAAFATTTYADPITGEELIAEQAGRVYLLYGRDYTLNPWPAEVNLAEEADAIFYGTDIGHRIGQNLKGLGDLNGDGWDDLGIAAYQYDTPNADGSANVLAGRIYVQWGAPTPSN